ncbi:MAG TPA: efflux transporter outer membrane subunit [Terriglobales bacterium]|nr:efflux transporter outer membrane subunit [Terriglobales bacterium]
MKSHFLSVVIAAGLMTGCAVGPNYHRPNVVAPPAFRGSEAAQPDAASLADAKWFEVFKDQQLQGLVRTALQNNFDVREAAARVEAARASLGITRADLYPTISAGGNVTTQRFSNSGSSPLPPGFGQERTFGTVSSSLLSYEVDLWGRVRRATEAARADLLASEENRRVVLITLVSDISTAYFSLLELDDELQVAKHTLATRQESLRLIQTRQSRGLSTLLEVRQGEQLVQSAAEAIPGIEERIAQTENQISLLIGSSPAPVVRTRTLTQQELPPAVPAGLPSSLIERRPDIRAAEQNLIAANATIGVAKAAYFPQISLTGLFGFQSNQLSSLFTGATRTWQFTPAINQPIFAGGRLKNNVRLSEANQNIALVQYQKSIQTAFRDVSDSLVQYQKQREIRIQQEALEATLQDRSRLSYRRYRGGVDTLLNALDADRDLFDAELRLAQTRRDELLSVVNLYKALGGGWQE